MIVLGTERRWTVIVIAGEFDERVAGGLLTEHRTAGGHSHVDDESREGDKANDAMGSSSTHDHIPGRTLYEHYRRMVKSRADTSRDGHTTPEEITGAVAKIAEITKSVLRRERMTPPGPPPPL